MDERGARPAAERPGFRRTLRCAARRGGGSKCGCPHRRCQAAAGGPASRRHGLVVRGHDRVVAESVQDRPQTADSCAPPRSAPAIPCDQFATTNWWRGCERLGEVRQKLRADGPRFRGICSEKRRRTARCGARPRGFEPLTFGSGGRRSRATKRQRRAEPSATRHRDRPPGGANHPGLAAAPSDRSFRGDRRENAERGRQLPFRPTARTR